MTESILDALSLLPQDYPHDFAEIFANYLVSEVKTEEDLLRYQLADAMVKAMEYRRKTQNKRLLDMAKAWKERKLELREQVVDFIASQSKEYKKPRFQSPAGLISHSVRSGHVSIDDEAAAIDWLLRSIDDGDMEGLLEVKTVLTPEGKEWIKEQAIRPGTLVPGTTCHPEYTTSTNSPQHGTLRQQEVLELAFATIFSKPVPDAIAALGLPAEGQIAEYDGEAPWERDQS